MLKIKQDLLDKIKENGGLRRELQAILGVGRSTMWRYLEENSEELTKAKVLLKIGEHYNLKQEDILETENEQAA